ncbi:hypothetical protein [Rhodopseudomonas telluris]|uniref:Uncharacterized protein n=1 Tax=Rhodopseudomonas telluris TaxID=644215 RepID=A0ABV6EZW8_9BRAD
MATSTNSLACLRNASAASTDADEELRVLTALIGCIMVAEDAADGSQRQSPLRHLSPPAHAEGLAKAL